MEICLKVSNMFLFSAAWDSAKSHVSRCFSSSRLSPLQDPCGNGVVDPQNLRSAQLAEALKTLPEIQASLAFVEGDSLHALFFVGGSSQGNPVDVHVVVLHSPGA